MNENPRRPFFDSIADQWDGWEDLNEVAERLAAGLDEMGLQPGETVVDVGCGTGNLTRVLLAKLLSAGRVVAVDISPRMLEVAKRKISDPRVEWIAVDATHLPFPDNSVDRVICYSVWPHFDQPAAAAVELLRVLRPGARLHIWHLASRQKINEIHASASEPICGDILAAGTKLACLFEECGFTVTEVIDDQQRYLVSAMKPSL